MDELTKLELELEKLSSMFFNSLNEVQRNAPLVNLENEEIMEESKENQDRMVVEKISPTKNYPNLINEKSSEINDTFENLNKLIYILRESEEYKKTDEELKKNLREMKDWNDLKIKSVNDKIKHIEDVINHVKKENDISNMHMRYAQTINFDCFQNI